MTLNSDTTASKSVKDNNRWFTLSNAISTLTIVFIISMVISPEVKSSVIKGLMYIGLFQPDIPEQIIKNTGDVQRQRITFQDEKGEVLNLSDLKGKVVFMNFWAAWCPPCIAEMPTIQTLYFNYKDNKDIVFVLVNVDGKLDESTAFMKRKKLNLPVYIATTAIPEAYFSGSLPTTVIIDKSGEIAFHHAGVANYGSKDVTTFIDKLIKQ